jgi:hypothetical protein
VGACRINCDSCERCCNAGAGGCTTLIAQLAIVLRAACSAILHRPNLCVNWASTSRRRSPGSTRVAHSALQLRCIAPVSLAPAAQADAGQYLACGGWQAQEEVRAIRPAVAEGDVAAMALCRLPGKHTKFNDDLCKFPLGSKVAVTTLKKDMHKSSLTLDIS